MTTSCIDRTMEEASWVDVILNDLVNQLGEPFRRRLFLAGAAGVAMLGLQGCSGGSTTETPLATGSAGFPVTVQGKEGTATVSRLPQRVIAVGLQRDADTAVALGVTPIAIPENASFDSLIPPWLEPELNDPQPELMNAENGIPFEKVAGLRPDLILATDSFSLADDYARLAQIAPTVSYLEGPNTDTWQQRTLLIGKALGRDEQAQKIVADTEGRIRQAADAHPAFVGKTVSFTIVVGREIYTVLDGDTSMTFLQQMGLRISPEVAVQPESSTEGRALVSLENVGVLDADVMLITYPAADDRTFLESSQLFQQLDAVKNRAYVPLDFQVAVALGFPTPLSIPYGLDRAVTEVAKALAS